MYIEIRPHHALCIRAFRGEGYSDPFCRNMREVISMLKADDPLVTISEGTDAICASCPNNNNGVCTDSEKVSGYDRKAAELCGVTSGARIRWSVFCASAYSNIVKKGLLRTVCGDCRWFYICGSSQQI